MPAALVLTPPQQKVLRYIAAHPATSTAEIAEAVYGDAPVGVANTHKALGVLLARKLVRRDAALRWSPTAAARQVTA